MTDTDDRSEMRARIIDAMTPGRPVSSARLRDLGLDLSPNLMRSISRASRAATSDAEAVIAADEIATSLTTKGSKERAARALRLAVAGTDRPAVRRDRPRDRETTPPSVTPQAQTREDRLEARLATLRGLGAEDLDGSPISAFDPRSTRS